MSSVAAANNRFWDRVAPAYAARPVADESAYQATLDRVRSYLAPTDRVLEFGCGTGSTALTLAPCVASILATDASSEMLGIARQKTETSGAGNIRFRRLTPDDDSLQPGSFDKVLAFNLLHLLADAPAAMRRIATLLVPGGLFLSKTPCIGELGVLPRVFIPVLRAVGRAPYVSYLGAEQLRQHVTDAGLEVLETGLYPRKTHSLFVVARKGGESSPPFR